MLAFKVLDETIENYIENIKTNLSHPWILTGDEAIKNFDDHFSC